MRGQIWAAVSLMQLTEWSTVCASEILLKASWPYDDSMQSQRNPFFRHCTRHIMLRDSPWRFQSIRCLHVSVPKLDPPHQKYKRKASLITNSQGSLFKFTCLFPLLSSFPPPSFLFLLAFNLNLAQHRLTGSTLWCPPNKETFFCNS